MLQMLDPASFKRPVVFFANGIGDHLTVLPTLRALSRVFAGRLQLIALPDAHSKYFSDVAFADVWPVQYIGVQKEDLGSFDSDALVRQIKRCDLFLSLARWHSPYLQQLIYSLEPKATVGFFSNFTHRLVDGHGHAFDLYFAAVRAFTSEMFVEDFAVPPVLAGRYVSLARDLQQTINGEYQLLVVHTDTKPRKMWLPDEFLATIDAFLSVRTNYLALVVGLWHELPLAQALNKRRIVTMCGTPLGLSLALVGIADLFLGVDSCMLHAADLFRVPGVGIFGPTDPQKWGFRFTRHRIVSANRLESIRSKHVVEALLTL